MKVIWTAEALAEVEGIVDYISVADPTAALSMVERIFRAVEDSLPSNPKLGRPGRVEGTRERIAHSSYIIAYQIARNRIEILTVRHTARLWPEEF